MNESVLFVVAMLLVKAALYFPVISYGISRFSWSTDHPKTFAAKLTAIRIAIGVTFAFPIWLLATLFSEAEIFGFASVYVAYGLVYGIARWFMWSVIAMWVVPGARSFNRFVFGLSATDRKWRASAVAVSFACDIPLWVLVGGPLVGKFFC